MGTFESAVSDRCRLKSDHGLDYRFEREDLDHDVENVCPRDYAEALHS